jgi:transcriptional regulator NrdR family protein
MRCPECGGPDRALEKCEHASWDRRRRQCLRCGARFTTYEVVAASVEIVTSPAVASRKFRIVRR